MECCVHPNNKRFGEYHHLFKNYLKMNIQECPLVHLTVFCKSYSSLGREKGRRTRPCTVTHQVRHLATNWGLEGWATRATVKRFLSKLQRRGRPREKNLTVARIVATYPQFAWNLYVARIVDKKWIEISAVDTMLTWWSSTPKINIMQPILDSNSLTGIGINPSLLFLLR